MGFNPTNLGTSFYPLQSILLASDHVPDGGLEAFLPRQAEAGSTSKEQPSSKSKSEEEDVQLRIAWQYGNYLKQQDGAGTKGHRGATPSQGWCHAYDITKPAGAEALSNCRHVVKAMHGRSAGSQLAACASQFVSSLAIAKGAPVTPLCIGRLSVLSLGSLGWTTGEPSATASAQAVQALACIKAAVRESRCSAIVTLPPSLHTASDVMRMQHIADAVIALAPAEEGSDMLRLATDAPTIAGLLRLVKVPSLGAMVAATPKVSLYFVRHKRRKLAITAVEVDPDAEAAEEAGAGGGSAASVLCGGPASKGGGDTLDF